MKKHPVWVFSLFLIIGSAPAGCGDDSRSNGEADGAIDATVQPDGEITPPDPSGNWCERIAAGPSGTQPFAVDLSSAHAAVRFFGAEPSDGTHSAYWVVDQTLASALNRPDPFSSESLAAYDQALDTVCVLEADDSPLPPAEVEMVDNVALVRPGIGSISLPAEAEAVAIDLRGLPADPGLTEALMAAVSPALSQPVTRFGRRVRRHYGLEDEVSAVSHAYNHYVVEHEPEPIPASGDRDLPLAVLTGPVLAPACAELAANLRLAGRAWLWGEDVVVRVAEARWTGVGDHGVVFMNTSFRHESQPVPDTVLADRRLIDPALFLFQLPQLGTPGDPTVGASTRPEIHEVAPLPQTRPTTLDPGVVRAALIIAHGSTRLFYPYFFTHGDNVDQRLVEVLDRLNTTDVSDRAAVRNLLRRFGASLNDGHVFIYDYAPPPSAGCLPILLDELDGEPVVRRSAVAQVTPGDTLLAIDGQNTADWFTAELARSSAATDGFRFVRAAQELHRLTGPVVLDLRNPDGVPRTEVIDPVSCGLVMDADTARTAGWLSDLGAPTYYYINLDQNIMSSMSAFTDALTEAVTAAGLVIDMRGYPTLDHYEVAQRLIDHSFQSPIFRAPVRIGPDDLEFDQLQYTFQPMANPSYSGPVVLLTGPRSLSAAENFSMMLVDAQRVTVVGRQSAGTNGNTTGFQVPGGFSFWFTGMEVQFADGGPFHGIGILPDEQVTLSASDFRDGVDRTLQIAIDVLDNP